MSHQNENITHENVNLTIQDNTHKPTFGEKVSGKLEQVVGKITKNPEKIAEGEAKKTGQPISPSSDDYHHDNNGEHHSHDSNRKAHIHDETKHSHSHLKESPYLSPVERENSISPISSTSNSNDNLNTAFAAHHIHDDKHSIHSQDIPPPPPSSLNPNVINQQISPNYNESDKSPLPKFAQPKQEIQGRNIPLPPSHQNSFAYANYEPTTPDENGDKSIGYLAHGGLPPKGQNQSDFGLGQGGVADRMMVAPPGPYNTVPYRE